MVSVPEQSRKNHTQSKALWGVGYVKNKEILNEMFKSISDAGWSEGHSSVVCQDPVPILKLEQQWLSASTVVQLADGFGHCVSILPTVHTANHMNWNDTV